MMSQTPRKNRGTTRATRAETAPDTTSPPLSGAERAKRHYQKKREEGLVRLTEWVDKRSVAILTRMALEQGVEKGALLDQLIQGAAAQ